MGTEKYVIGEFRRFKIVCCTCFVFCDGGGGVYLVFVSNIGFVLLFI